MDATEALTTLTTRLVQAETDLRLLEDAADHAKAERDLLRQDLDLVVKALKMLVPQKPTSKRRNHNG